jgi:hypothetical protein
MTRVADELSGVPIEENGFDMVFVLKETGELDERKIIAAHSPGKRGVFRWK